VIVIQKFVDYVRRNFWKCWPKSVIEYFPYSILILDYRIVFWSGKMHKIQLITNSNIYILRNRIQSAKNEVPALDKSDIYQIAGGSRGCNYSYIGRSRRAIKNRFVEHLRAYKNNHSDSSAVAYHMFFDKNDQKRRYQHEFSVNTMTTLMV
jgi:hypothetical protein